MLYNCLRAIQCITLNGCLESVTRGLKDVYEGYDIWKGKSILELLQAFDLNIANTGFRKRDKHFIIYKIGVTCS